MIKYCNNCNSLEGRIECNNIFMCEILLNSENKLIFIAFSNSYNEGIAGQISAVSVRFMFKVTAKCHV